MFSRFLILGVFPILSPRPYYDDSQGIQQRPLIMSLIPDPCGRLHVYVLSEIVNAHRSLGGISIYRRTDGLD